MKPAEIDGFFRLLDEKLGLEAEVILIGASAGALMGNTRASVDIDFEIRPKKELDLSQKERVHGAVTDCSKVLGIAVDFSDDVGHWSMISFLDYRRTAVPYKKIGKLNVKLISPEYWTIGKLARSLELDVQDVMSIIRIKKIKADALIEVWAKAIRSSQLSLELGAFRRNVEYFLNKCGPQLWGKSYDSQKMIALFHEQAGIKTS